MFLHIIKKHRFIDISVVNIKIKSGSYRHFFLHHISLELISESKILRVYITP